jgi:hypothetical protein
MNLPSKWVACDPGESLGYAVARGARLEHAGTAELWDFIHAFAVAMGLERPREGFHDEELVKRLRGCELLVYENWAIYPWKAQELAWDECRTARGIGALEFICQASGIPYAAQGAKVKDQAEAAGAADLFLRPLHENRHANDAIRHATVKALSAGEGLVTT